MTDISQEYTSLGSSPELLTDLENWLRNVGSEAQELHIALYLFNNLELWNLIEEISQKGCKVFIYSIPLEGYDNDKPIEIFSAKTGASLGRKTKLFFAEQIYQKAKENKNLNIQFYIFPHMYLRSSKVRKFSRGAMPYSLHCKIMMLKCRSGKTFVGISSSNLAVRDASKIELGFVSELNPKGIASVIDFFEGLRENSISILDFDENKDYSHFQIVKRETPAKANLMFTSPFYLNSSTIFEKNIETIMSRAEKRIIICAQHVCAYNYYSNNKNHKGFLTEVLNKAQNNIPTTIISQTYVDENGQSYGCRAPQNIKQFTIFIREAKNSGCQYYTNPNIHAKYIVVDDVVLITTSNFTPTQFIYIEDINIPAFDNMPGFSYHGTFCEVGAYYAIRDVSLANLLSKETENIISLESTQMMF